MHFFSSKVGLNALQSPVLYSIDEPGLTKIPPMGNDFDPGFSASLMLFSLPQMLV